MARHLLKRFLLTLPALWLVLTLVFLIQPAWRRLAGLARPADPLPDGRARVVEIEEKAAVRNQPASVSWTPRPTPKVFEALPRFTPISTKPIDPM